MAAIPRPLTEYEPNEALDNAVRNEIARMTSAELATFALDPGAAHNTPSFCALVDRLVGKLLREALSKRTADPDVADFECALAEMLEQRLEAGIRAEVRDGR